MSRSKVEKKDFSFTEVVETFKALVDAGMTPQDFKTLRSNPRILAQIITIIDHNSALFCENVSSGIFMYSIISLVIRGRRVYVFIDESEGKAILLLKAPDGFDKLPNLPIYYMDGHKIYSSQVIRSNDNWTKKLVYEMFSPHVGYVVTETERLSDQPAEVTVFSINK